MIEIGKILKNLKIRSLHISHNMYLYPTVTNYYSVNQRELLCSLAGVRLFGRRQVEQHQRGGRIHNWQEICVQYAKCRLWNGTTTTCCVAYSASNKRQNCIPEDAQNKVYWPDFKVLWKLLFRVSKIYLYIVAGVDRNFDFSDPGSFILGFYFDFAFGKITVI